MKRQYSKIMQKIFAPILFRIENDLEELKEEFKKENENLHQKLLSLGDDLKKNESISKSTHDNIHQSALALHAMRQKPSYINAFKGDPLVSVRIATYNRAELLINKTLASILKQTYKNFEVVIIGDHCTDDTEEKLKSLNDKRIRFYNLPSRPPYPNDRHSKWQVIGALSMNEGAAMARGEWIAPIDDDDEFTPDHIEKLVKHAKKTKAELVYGASIQKSIVTGKEVKIWSNPPQISQFTFHSAIYLKDLDDIFKYDFHSWVLDEVADWNLCRRMIESGVRYSAIEDTVGIIHMIPPGHEKKEY